MNDPNLTLRSFVRPFVLLVRVALCVWIDREIASSLSDFVPSFFLVCVPACFCICICNSYRFFDNYVIPLAKKLKECGVFGVSSDEYLNYALENRREWANKGEAAVSRMIEKYATAAVVVVGGGGVESQPNDNGGGNCKSDAEFLTTTTTTTTES